MLNRSSSIGFLITIKSDLTFLGPFIDNLGPEKFFIVYEDREKGISLHGNQLQMLKKYFYPKFNQYNFISISQLIANENKLDLLISIHPYIIHDFKLLAKKNFRLSYSISKFSWQFGEINNYYDLVFTQGPYSTQMIKSIFGLPCVEVGFPRYLNNQKVRNEHFFQVIRKTHKPIVSFFPAIGSRSIQHIEEILRENLHKIDFLIKVHPIEDEDLNEYYKKLSKTITVIFENDEQLIQNETIIMNSDLIVHDIGGTCFSSLYYERNFAFLKRSVIIDKVLETTPEDLLYKLISRTLDQDNFMNSLETLLSNPLEYDQKLRKIRDLFITKNSSRKFNDALGYILEFDRSLVSYYTFSHLSIVIRKFFFKILSFKLKFKLIHLLKGEL